MKVRLSGIVSQGEDQRTFFFGGDNTLRGYDYRSFAGNNIFFMNSELRFPLIDVLVYPYFPVRDVRGRIFFDVGGAWFDDEDFTFSDSEGGFRLVDGRSSFGVGLGFFFLGDEVRDELADVFEKLKARSYRWGTPEWLEMRRKVMESDSSKAGPARKQRGIYKTVRSLGLEYLM